MLELYEASQPGLDSIEVPCYNAERFLTETFAQSYPHTEVIVIDDSSTDAADVIRSHSDRVKAEFGPNRGASGARNRGTALARGEYWEKLVETDQGVGERVERRIEDRDANLDVALLRFWAPPAALTYQRTIVDKIGGWKEWLPIIQDARSFQDAALLGGQFVHAPGVGAISCSYRREPVAPQ
jgi:glycosyltransferase involved in cell wall biosynthesis